MYKARAIKETYTLGETHNNNLEVSVILDIKSPVEGGASEQMTTFLYFNGGAAKISFDRLHALGWKGQGVDDIDNPDGIGDNEVDVKVTGPQNYTASDGTTKMGSAKVEIMTGGGRGTNAKPIDASTFKARLKALLGGGGPAPSGGASPTQTGKGSPPPF
jgi:hypothetical protein